MILDHVRRKNCEGNPWCLYGLGEQKEGIWKNSDLCLEVLCGKQWPGKQWPVRRLGNPGGLKNCGATCYLSVIFQVRYTLLLHYSIYNKL